MFNIFKVFSKRKNKNIKKLKHKNVHVKNKELNEKIEKIMNARKEVWIECDETDCDDCTVRYQFDCEVELMRGKLDVEDFLFYSVRKKYWDITYQGNYDFETFLKMGVFENERKKQKDNY